MISANETQRPGSGAFAFALLLTILFFVLCCGSTSTDPTGGETHFLKVCDPQGADCGEGLACLCGVCSVSCAADTACEGHASAQCLAAGDAATCAGAESANYCDVSCRLDADCAAISPTHRCEQGRCRAPLGACPRGDTAASQVVVLGDSFFATGMHQITASLEALALNAGVLGADDHYRDNSNVTENSLANPGAGIASQYALAVADAPVKVVIMNGGGADALIGSCDVATPDCPLLVDAAAAARLLFGQMAGDGVEQIVYAYYPDPIEPTLQDKIDALRPLIRDACAESPVPCAFLDLRPAFDSHYDDYVLPDGMNPNAQGAAATAAAIWTLMQLNCIAQ
jgi:hypothetical protein